MNRVTLIALWKANVPHWVWIASPLWIGAIALGLDGRTPEWGPIALFTATIIIIQCTAELANSYSDRDEDHLYGPTNTMVTGELDTYLAKKILVFQNIIAIILLIALLSVTRNYLLCLVIVTGWFFSMAYSVSPLRLKETMWGPFSHAISFALLPVAGWLIVQPSITTHNGFIIGFSIILFLYSFALGITLKFRKTLLALNSGIISMEEGGNLFKLRTIGFKMRYREAMSLEAFTAILPFVLVLIFWYQDIFDATLSIGLLAGPLPLTIIAVFIRARHPVKNGAKHKTLMTLAWIFISVLLLGIGLSNHLPLGFAISACILFLAGFPLLVRIVHPWGSKSIQGQY